jgi:ATP-dependent Clp protease ATP-binding subunit ClpC
LNRFDDIVVFRQLTRDDVGRILALELEKVRVRLGEKGKKLVLSRSARDFLIDQGFNPASGARPLRRSVERFVEDPLAEEILRGSLIDAKTIEVTKAGSGLKFRSKVKVAQKSATG